MMRRILMYFSGSTVPPTPDNTESYALAAPSSQGCMCPSLDEQVEMALLNDLERPLVLVILGGGEKGKQLAVSYLGHHTEDPAMVANLLDTPL